MNVFRSKRLLLVVIIVFITYTTYITFQLNGDSIFKSKTSIRHSMCDTKIKTIEFPNGDSFHIFDAIEKNGELQILAFAYSSKDSKLEWGSHYELAKWINTMQFRCRFHSQGNSQTIATIARKEVNKHKFFFRLYCDIPYNQMEHFSQVEIVDDSDIISISFSTCTETVQKTNTVSACVSSLHGKVNLSYIQQWIEYHRLIGVEHFYFFDRDRSFEKLFDPYIKEGIVTYTVKPLYRKNLQRSPSPDQFFLFNQCLMRYGPYHDWMIFMDIDEYVNLKVDDHNISKYLTVN